MSLAETDNRFIRATLGRYGQLGMPWYNEGASAEGSLALNSIREINTHLGSILTTLLHNPFDQIKIPDAPRPEDQSTINAAAIHSWFSSTQRTGAVVLILDTQRSGPLITPEFVRIPGSTSPDSAILWRFPADVAAYHTVAAGQKIHKPLRDLLWNQMLGIFAVTQYIKMNNIKHARLPVPASTPGRIPWAHIHGRLMPIGQYTKSL